MAENSILASPHSYTINEVSGNEDASFPAANLRDSRVFLPFRTTSMSGCYVVLDTGVADPAITLIAAPFARHGKEIKWQIRTAATAANLQTATPPGPFTDDSGSIDAIPNAGNAAVITKLGRFRYVCPLLWKTHTNGFTINVRYIRIDFTDSVASILELGRLVLSAAFQFQRNPGYGGRPVQFKEAEVRSQNARSQSIGIRVARKRETSWTYEAKSETEWLEDFGGFMEDRGTDQDLIFCWDPTHLHAHHYTFLGKFSTFDTALPHFDGYQSSFGLQEVADPLK